MKGRNHIIVGFATAALVQGVAPFVHAHSLFGLTLGARWMLTTAAAAAMVGGLIPDVDLATSLVAHETGTGRGQGCLTGMVFHWVRKLLGGHRGFTHSLWACVICGFVLGLNVGTLHLGDYALPIAWNGLLGSWSDLGPAFTLGYLSHILADMLTREGVKFGWPLVEGDVGLGPRVLRFSNGSWREYIWVVAWVVVALWPWIYR